MKTDSQPAKRSNVSSTHIKALPGCTTGVVAAAAAAAAATAAAAAAAAGKSFVPARYLRELHLVIDSVVEDVPHFIVAGL